MRNNFCVAALLAATWITACSGTSASPDGGRRDGGTTADGGATGDGGINRPEMTITADPATGQVGQEVTFTAAITAGTPPYLTCTWKFFALDTGSSGTLSGSSCTGKHTYNEGGPKSVTVDVQDSALRIGTMAISYLVGADGSTGTEPDLSVKTASLSLVSPPPSNRYAQGSMIHVAFTVQNKGSSSAGSSSAAVSLKNLFDSSLTELGQAAVGEIAAGGEQVVSPTFTISASQAPGAYTIVLNLDVTGAVTEANESNNTFSDPTAVNFEITTPDGGP